MGCCSTVKSQPKKVQLDRKQNKKPFSEINEPKKNPTIIINEPEIVKDKPKPSLIGQNVGTADNQTKTGYKYNPITINTRQTEITDEKFEQQEQINEVEKVEKHLDQKLLLCNMDTGTSNPSPNIFTFEYGNIKGFIPIVGDQKDAQAF